ncbi:MAG: hypothetical protein J6I96_03215 [Oscillospiraceae bacterium]|nr:hypothetical protein [Oscillospiraceae bacterium]
MLGAKRGLIRTVIGVVFTAAAFIGAAYLSSDSICGQVYDRYIKERTMAVIDEAMDTAQKRVKDTIAEKAKEGFGSITDEYLDEGTSDGMKGLFSDFIDNHRKEIDSTISGIANRLGIDVGEVLKIDEVDRRINEAAELYSETAAERINAQMPFGLAVEPLQIKQIITDKQLLELFADEVIGLSTEESGFEDTADYIEEQIMRPMILKAVHIVLWIGAFLLIKLVLSLVTALISAIINSSPVIEGTDALLGCLLGIIGGLALSVFLAAAVSAVINLTGGMTYVNEDIISNTYIFGFLYDLVGRVGSLLV